MKWVGNVGVFAVLCVGCGGGGGGMSKPVAVFPSKAEIEDVMMKDTKVEAATKTVDVPSWQLTTAVPAPGAAYPSESPWDHYFVGRFGGGKAKLSPELRCASTEVARYFVEAGGYPDDATRRYVAERCGSTLPTLSFSYMSGDVPDGVSDAQIAAKYEHSLDELCERAHVASGSLVGLGVAREKGKVSIVMFSGRPVAELSSFVPLVPGTSVTLEGHVSAEAAFALALVNQGTSGVAACEPDRRVALPHFRVTCPFSANDAQTRIEIATRKPNRVMMDTELTALVRHSDDAGLTYEPVTRGSDAVATDAAAFELALFGQLNDVRHAAGVPPFTLEPKQSDVNQRLAPHLYQASLEGNTDLEDRIGLGVLAGWDVGGVIRDGGMHWGSVTSTRSPGRYLSYALESPFARFVLLDPSMTRVAIGASALPPTGAVALLTTYAFFKSTDHSADENAVFAELNKRRHALGHGPAKRVAREVALDTALARVATHTDTTENAMQEAMARVVENERTSVRGWVVETSDLRQIPWSDLLLNRDPLSVEVGVTHYKAPGGAWGQYALIFIIREASSMNTAKMQGRAKF
jgi:hypothetical protein